MSVYWPTFVRHPAYKWTAIVLWLAVSTPAQPQPHPWHDPSKHKVQLVTVDEGVQLEVLDWGGSGRPLVLLAGGGNTAHVYDGFAGKLTKYAHVYGITRRGYGASTRPASGYSEQRLAEDVRQVLDSLHLAAPVLAGHSMGGSELAVFACMYPHRAAGLILMDSAIIDPAKDESQLYDELRDKLPDAMVPQKPPTLADDKSIPLFQGWLIQSDGAAFPESEIRATRDGNRRKSAEDPGAAAREQAVLWACKNSITAASTCPFSRSMLCPLRWTIRLNDTTRVMTKSDPQWNENIAGTWTFVGPRAPLSLRRRQTPASSN